MKMSDKLSDFFLLLIKIQFFKNLKGLETIYSSSVILLVVLYCAEMFRA